VLITTYQEISIMLNTEAYTHRQILSSFQENASPLPLNNDTSSIPPESQQKPVESDAPSSVNTDLNGTSSENQTTSSLIFVLKTYKYEYFLSKLSCNFDRDGAKFGSPRGICTLNNDRLLVANFDYNSLLLLDIYGTVYQIYKDLPTPKDVLCHPSNPSQAVVATQKEVIILDLNTKDIVKRSKLRGFYPWNIQYIKEHDYFAACDPSGERILFLDKDLADVGSWSFNEQNPSQVPQSYQKIYPYATYFFS